MNIPELREVLRGNDELVGQSLLLERDAFHLAVRSNKLPLLESLATYFGLALLPAQEATARAPARELIAIEGDAPELPLVYRDWEREPGKQGRKDSVVDFDNTRLVHKVRTGVQFLQQAGAPLARGPLQRNANQLVNFIVSQYMNYLQQRDWLIAHAAALTTASGALAIAGFSGGGKSTLMLRLLDEPDTAFVSNDRSFFLRHHGEVRLRGVPKLPRVNPGTLLHNSHLRKLLPTVRQSELQLLTTAELWNLEEKYDVPLRELYGPNRVEEGETVLSALLLLAWHRDETEPTRLERVDLDQQRDLLPAIMKSPGPFYQDGTGLFLANGVHPMEDPYLAVLQDLPVYALRGRADFDRARDLLVEGGLL